MGSYFAETSENQKIVVIYGGPGYLNFRKEGKEVKKRVTSERNLSKTR
jgi:hypothetical protein